MSAISLPLSGELKSDGRLINTIDIFAESGITVFGGDTYQFTAWTGPGTGGKWNGGHVFGSYNDGHGCPEGGGNIAFLEITAIDFGKKANTAMNCVNNMRSYGNAAHQPEGWKEDGIAWKSFNPFSYNGNIYWFVNRQEISSPWHASMSTVITSPDRGVHWCNPATFAAGGKGGPQTCDSGNYKADGDAPPSPDRGMMWGTPGDSTGPMARPMIVQFCQDQNCTGMPFDADHYLYFVTNTGLIDKLYAACVAKSPAAIMDSSKYWYWTGGNGTCGDTSSWTHAVSSAVPIQNQAVSLAGYASSVIYIKEAGQFLMTSYYFDNRPMFLVSERPWGPWRRIFIAPVGNQGGFTSTNLAWLDSSCDGCNANPGRWRLTYTGSVYGHTSDATLYLHQVEITNGEPADSIYRTQPGTARSIRAAARVPVTGGAHLVPRGLSRLFLFDDSHDYPPGVWSGGVNRDAAPYYNDLTGSGACLVAGNNQGVPPIYWGRQTNFVQYTAAGLSLGADYSAQAVSMAGECTGALPVSGDSAFTVQSVFTASALSPGRPRVIFSMVDPAGPTAHKDFYIGLDLQWQGGIHLDIHDIGSVLTSSPNLTAGQAYLFTVVKTRGPVSPQTVKLYIGTTEVPLVQSRTDGAPLNLSSNLMVRLGCYANGSEANCNPGTWQGELNPGVHSFLALYNRALTKEESDHNYEVIRDALGQPSRGVKLR